MSSGELAALITAFGVSLGAVVTAIAALRNANYSAAKVADLNQRVAAAEAREVNARRRVNYLKRLLLQRESENNRLLAREKNWQRWGDQVGRMLNELQLEVGALQQQISQQQTYKPGDTQPLPAVPRSPGESA